MTKYGLNPNRRRWDICPSRAAYALKTTGKPRFRSIDKLVETLMSKVTAPEWARGAPVIGYTKSGNIVGSPTIMWWTGETYKGGEYNNITYYVFKGFGFGQDDLTYNPLYWELGDAEPLEYTSGVWGISQNILNGDPDGPPADVLTFESLGEPFQRAEALTEFFVYRKVGKNLKVTPMAIQQQTDWSRGHVPVEFKGRPVFAGFYDDAPHEASASGPHSTQLAQRLVDLGILKRVEVPEEEQQLSWPVAYAVAPEGINKIVILDPLGIVLMRNENFEWLEVDLVTDRQRKLSPHVKKVLKMLKGGPTRYQVWWHQRGNEYNEKCVALELDPEGNPPHHCWPTNDPYWRKALFQPEEKLLTHRRLAKLIRERKGKATIVADLI